MEALLKLVYVILELFIVPVEYLLQIYPDIPVRGYDTSLAYASMFLEA